MQFGKKISDKSFMFDNIDTLDLKIGAEISCYITIGDKKEEHRKCKIMKIEDGIITINDSFDKIFIYGTYENDVRSIQYENFIPLLIKDSQQKTEKINKLESELNELKNLVQSLMS